jgi:hypothetical protein
MELTGEQLARFKAFGFLQLRAYSAGELAALVAAAAAAYPAVVDTVERTPLLTELLVQRFLGPVRQLLGEGFVWSGSEFHRAAAGADGNLGAGALPRAYREQIGLADEAYAEHTWHADRPGVSECAYPRIKVMAYLTPTGARRGALRVIPGSHAPALHELLEPLQRCHAGVNRGGQRLSSADPEWAARTFGTAGLALPAHVCAVEPGEVILFHHSLFHAAYYHYAGRLLFAAKFAARPATPAHHASNMRFARGTYRPSAFFREHRDPAIRAMCAQCSAPGAEAAAVAAMGALPWEAREKEFYGPDSLGRVCH